MKSESFIPFSLWRNAHQRKILFLLAPFLSAVAILRLGFEFYRLLLDTSHHGAVDLRLIHQMVQNWFSGRPLVFAYPPASAVLLWPFVGWLPFAVARWLWAGILIFVIVYVVRAFIRACGFEDRLQRIVAGLFVLSIYPTAVVVGNGQLPIHLIAALMASLFLLQPERKSWKADAAAVFLLLFAMVKPNFSIPFLLLVCFVCGAWRIVLAVAVLYLGITLMSISFQDRDILEAVSSWSNRALLIDDGYGHFHLLLFRLGIPEWSPVFSFALLALLGIWLYHYRNEDLWILLAVTAIFARVWTYHRLFDDFLLLLPIVALCRIVQQAPQNSRGRATALGLLVFCCISLLQPGTLLTLTTPWGTFFRSLQILLWIAVFIFLLTTVSRRIGKAMRKSNSRLESGVASKI